ncbi:hypothetical protein LJR015_004051 [Peribacillus frigoritolerans]|uniref:hypothetical protein n=1 Tax=Peribacillus frigoritolerans TaxID=450367 RepID=UPI003ECDB07D
MMKLADLEKGDKIYFLEGSPDTFTVQAKKDKFIVATAPLEKGVQYTIVDTEKNICGPHDRTFNAYDLSKKEDVTELLNDLIERKRGITLSRRHSANVALVLNLPKTLKGE